MASKMNNKKLDQTFQKKVKHVQKHNGIHVFWDKEGIWRRIQKALEESTSGPKMIAWYTVMAASVSLLVASAVNLMNYDFEFLNEIEPQVAEASIQPLNLEKSSRAEVYYTALPSDSMTIPLRSRPVLSLSEEIKFAAVDRLPENNKRLQRFTKYSLSDISKPKFNPNLRVRLVPGLSANSRFVIPKVDVGLILDLSKTSDVRKRVFVGSSIQFLQSVKSEQAFTNRVFPSYFFKSSYENERVENGKVKSWSAGVEFLIHSADDSLPGNMLKVFYNHSVLGRLKIGPELMFTNSFKKVYPGITLALG